VLDLILPSGINAETLLNAGKHTAKERLASVRRVGKRVLTSAVSRSHAQSLANRDFLDRVANSPELVVIRARIL
jgi:hypothetical protein